MQLTNKSDIFINRPPLDVPQKPANEDYREERKLTLQELFTVYSSMVEGHKFVPPKDKANFLSAEPQIPLHVEALAWQQQQHEQQQKQQQSADALASRLAGLALRDHQVVDSQVGGTGGTSMETPRTLVGSTGPQGLQGHQGPQGPPGIGLQEQLGQQQQQQQQHPRLLEPSQIQWYYLDPQGTQQGPFDGLTMQQWYTQKYLAPDLRIRRDGQTEYKPLGDFVSFIGEYQFPFSIPLPPIQMRTAPPPHFAVSLGARTSSTSSLGAQNTPRSRPGTPLAANQGIPLSNSASFSALGGNPAWSVGNNGSFLGSGLQNPLSGSLAAGNLSPIGSNLAGGIGNGLDHGLGGGLYGQGAFLPNVNLQGKLFSTPKPVSVPEGNSVEKAIVRAEKAADEEKPKEKVKEKKSEEKQREKVKEEKLEEKPREIVKEARKEVKPKEEIKKAVKEAKEVREVKKAVEKKQKQASVHKQHVSHVVKTAEPEKHVDRASKTVIAPWATVTQKKVTPAFDLEEIQRQEKEKSRREAEHRRVLEEAERNKQQDEEVEEDSLDASGSVALPATATWGNDSGANALDRQAAEIKSWAEVKRDEVAKIEKQKKLLKAAKKQQAVKFTSADLSSGGSWTVVTSKKAKGAAKEVVSRSGLRSYAKKPSSALSPDALRSVSAPKGNLAGSANAWTTVNRQGALKSTKPVSASPLSSRSGSTTPSVKSSAPKAASSDYSQAKQFLAWCRTKFAGLYSSVNKEDVLSIMLQLPAGSESTEIIADTIYSNSSTMDGRRFASEFNARRSKVEGLFNKQGYDFDWQQLLKSSSGSSGSEDGWDAAFTKVTRRRRH